LLCKSELYSLDVIADDKFRHISRQRLDKQTHFIKRYRAACACTNLKRSLNDGF